MQAAIEAAHLRFRPIVMTSMAFILGVVPLFIASGAGSASQRAIGTGVMGRNDHRHRARVILFRPSSLLSARFLAQGTESGGKRRACTRCRPDAGAFIA